jgi:hypothetical protein
MIAGKRSNGCILIFVALTIIVLSLFYVAIRDEHTTYPKSGPMLQQR